LRCSSPAILIGVAAAVAMLLPRFRHEYLRNRHRQRWTSSLDLSKVGELKLWQPNPWGGEFRVLSRSEPLLFKLKALHNAIAGGGFFQAYTGQNRI
jgi:hypothetical protein